MTFFAFEYRIKSTDTTEQPFTDPSIKNVEILIVADADNAADVKIGGDDVARGTGFPLAATKDISFPIGQLNELHVSGTQGDIIRGIVTSAAQVKVVTCGCGQVHTV